MATQWTAGLSALTPLPAATLNTIGAASELWTPTFTNFTLGNGTIAARYIQIQKLVFCHLQISCGSTTSCSGVLNFTGPVASRVNNNIPFGNVWWFDVSAGLQVYGRVVGVSGTNFYLGTDTAGSTFVGQGYSGPTTPFTIASGDAIYATFTYEAA